MWSQRSAWIDRVPALVDAVGMVPLAAVVQDARLAAVGRHLLRLNARIGDLIRLRARCLAAPWLVTHRWPPCRLGLQDTFPWHGLCSCCLGAVLIGSYWSPQRLR